MSKGRNVRHAQPRPRVAIVHDYLTQRGGAERVVLEMAAAFPSARIHTSLFNPATTFPAFDADRVRAMGLSRFKTLRDDHRRALPLLAPAFSRTVIDADAVICSSSGWAHGVRTTGRKIVFCYTPARWLYQTDRYLRGQGLGVRTAAAALRPPLRRWDRACARSADRYLVISRSVRDRVERLYGIQAEVVHPPHTIDIDAAADPVAGIEPGFWLTVARLLPYKNVDVTLAAFATLPDQRLLVVGAGPEAGRLKQGAPPNVGFFDCVSDARLRWLYANCTGVVAASYEDYGLTPLEAAAFGKPSVALRWGGYLDTIIDGETGTLVAHPDAGLLADAVRQLQRAPYDPGRLVAHAAQFDAAAFRAKLRAVIDEEVALSPTVRTAQEPSWA